MAQEDQIEKGSNSSGGCFDFSSINSRSLSKKLKQRKTPQRGLGVAQLEKIRLEEQQKKDVASIASASILSSPSSMTSSLPILNQPHSNHAQADLSSSNSITRPPFPIQNVPLVNRASYGGFEALWPGITVLGQEDGPKMWNSCEFNAEKGNYAADPGFPFQSNIFLPYYSNFSCPPIQFTHEYQPSSSISVNTVSATSSSSMINFPMELPSNQNYNYNYPTNICPKEEKIGGMKRPYPFSLDNPPGLSSNYKWLTSVPTRPDLPLYDNGGSLKNPNFRDNSSYSTSTFAQPGSKCSIENSSGGDFLTLATPSLHPAIPDFELLPFQVRKKGDEVGMVKSKPSSQPFYSFFPPADVTPIRHAPSKNNGEMGESVDLNLKL